LTVSTSWAYTNLLNNICHNYDWSKCC